MSTSYHLHQIDYEEKYGELDTMQKLCMESVIQRHQIMAEKEKENDNNEDLINDSNAVSTDNNDNELDDELNNTLACVNNNESIGQDAE